jgi:hypothetical protein
MKWKGTATGIGLLVVTGVAFTLLVKGLYPVDLPESHDPDFLDTVFDNRGVVWAARLLLVSAAGVLACGGIFIVLSIGIRIKNGEWLRRAGPFEISEGPVGQAEGELEFWRRAAEANEEKTVELRDRLRRADELIQNLQRSC